MIAHRGLGARAAQGRSGREQNPQVFVVFFFVDNSLGGGEQARELDQERNAAGVRRCEEGPLHPESEGALAGFVVHQE